jgi:hypothetical protein
MVLLPPRSVCDVGRERKKVGAPVGESEGKAAFSQWVVTTVCYRQAASERVRHKLAR